MNNLEDLVDPENPPPTLADFLKFCYQRVYGRSHTKPEELLQHEDRLKEAEQELAKFLATSLGDLQALAESSWAERVALVQKLQDTDAFNVARIEALTSQVSEWQHPECLEVTKDAMHRLLYTAMTHNTDMAFELGPKPTFSEFLAARQDELQKAIDWAEANIESCQEELRIQTEREAALASVLEGLENGL